MREVALAKDLRDFCASFNVTLEMIPLKPNNISSTLAGKEAKHFRECDAAIFLITARDPQGTVSGSVVHELGQATNKFEDNPEKVIVIAEDVCQFPATEQRARNTFSKNDLGSILRALTLFVEELRNAGLLGRATHAPGVEATSFGLEQALKTRGLVETIIFVSHQKEAAIEEDQLDPWLLATLKLNQQEINLLKDSLQRHNLAMQMPHSYGSGWRLLRSGLDLAKIATEAGHGVSQ